MNRLHTCPSNFHQSSFRLQTNASVLKKRLQTEHMPTYTKNSNHLVQALKQNRQKQQKDRSKKKVIKGLLDFSLRKFKQNRVSVPIFNSQNIRFIKEIRNSVQSTGVGPSHTRIKVDMNQIEQLKKDILLNLNSFSFLKEKHTPLISQRIEEPKQNIQQQRAVLLQVESQERLKETLQIKQYIQSKIDTLGQMLDRVSMLMTINKIQFRTTLFLFYKLFWVTRVSLTTKISLLKGEQDQQLLNQNRSIQQCLTAMMHKLKQSKKWKQYEPKYIFQEMNLNESGKIQLVKILLKYLIKDYAKLMKAMQYNNQNTKNMHQFGISFLFTAKEYLDKDLFQQASKQVRNVQKPQKKDLEWLFSLLNKIEKGLSE